MTVFEPSPADDYEWVQCRTHDDNDIISNFDGTPRTPAWEPIKVFRLRPDEDSLALRSDTPWFRGSALVLRRSAVEALSDVLRGDAEVLSLSTDDDVELFVLNVRVIDALDEERSSIMRFPDGRIMRVTKVQFLAGRIPDGVNIFRLPHRISSIYVSQRFVDAYQAAGLKGMVFLPRGES